MVRWAEHVGGKRVQNFFKMLFGEPEDKRQLVRPCNKWDGNKLTGLKEVEHEGVDWIYVV
jgi:hypothetical protein